MTDIRTPTLQAYDRVIDRVQTLYAAEHGTPRGAKEWFANQLGITRQTLDNWGKRAGILPTYVDQVAKITGLKKSEVRPDTLLLELSPQDWSVLSKGQPKDLIARVTVHPLRRKYG